MKYEVYTDGSCLRNPGPGGYACVLISHGKELNRIYGKEENTTNNRMELKAIVRALKHMNKYCVDDAFFESKTKTEATIYSDSAYCISPINEGWIHSWATNGWKTKSGEEVKNKDLWEMLYEYLVDKNYVLEFVKVKGHSGNEYNEIVDALAKKAASMNDSYDGRKK